MRFNFKKKEETEPKQIGKLTATIEITLIASDVPGEKGKGQVARVVSCHMNGDMPADAMGAAFDAVEDGIEEGGTQLLENFQEVIEKAQENKEE